MNNNGTGSRRDSCIQNSANKQASNNPVDKVRALNDQFRRTGEGGMIVITAGIEALEPTVREELFQAIRIYDAFNPDNDPYTEHDFGNLTIESHKVFWKIDYYAPDLVHGSIDPANPDCTIRVLTVMLAVEY